MSQTSALSLGQAAPKGAPRQPLRVVRGGAVVRQAWFVIGCLATLVLGLLATLMLNTALAEGTYRQGALRVQANELADRQEVLTHELDNLRAPASVAKRAVSLGMVPGQSPAFIRLGDGRVLGVAKATTAADRFTVITSPTLPATSGVTAKKAPSSKATKTAPATKKKATTKKKKG